MQTLEIDISKFCRRLRWIKWFNVGFVTGFVSFASSFVASALKGDAEGSIVIAVLLLLMALPAWMAWRNINVVDSLTNRWSIRSLLAVLLVGSVISLLLTIVVIYAKAETSPNLYVLLMIVAWGSVLAGVAAIMTWRLRHAFVDQLDIALVVLLRQLNGLRHRPRGVRTVPQRPVLAIACVAVGVLLLVGIDLVPLDKIQASQNWRLVNGVSQMGFLSFLYARSALQPSARTLLAGDHRTPILLLRSFVDDERITAKKSETSFVDSSLESRLTTHFVGFGPFIAVGAPSDTLPVIGAARAQLSDSEWQMQVVDWIDDAAVILMLAGTTKWVDWELRKILEHDAVAKLIVAFPPYQPSRAWKDKKTRKFGPNMNARLEQLHLSMADTRWAPALSALSAPEDLRAMIFNEEGGLTVVRATTRDRNTYHLAVLVAHWVRLSIDGKVASESAVQPTASQDRVANLGPTFAAAMISAVVAFLCLADEGLPILVPIALAAALSSVLFLPALGRAMQRSIALTRVRVAGLAVAVLLAVHGLAVGASEVASESLLDGNRLTPGAVRALGYAAWAGLPTAQQNLGRAYISGIGVPADSKRGCALIRRYANDSADDRRLIGLCIHDGLLQPRLGESVVGLLRDSADSGDKTSQKVLGDIYFKGTGVAVDVERARHYLMPLAAEGDPDAAFSMALITIGREGSRADYASAVPYMHTAAAGGDPAANALLGAAAVHGDGMAVDYDLALRCNRKAAEGGEPVGQLNYAVQLMNGWGTPRNVEAARHWLGAAMRSGGDDTRKIAKANLDILDRTR